jgi:hypothetical protein
MNVDQPKGGWPAYSGGDLGQWIVCTRAKGTRTRIHRAHQLKVRRKRQRAVHPRDSHDAVLQRLPQHLDRARLKLRQLVQEQHPPIRQRNLARMRQPGITIPSASLAVAKLCWASTITAPSPAACTVMLDLARATCQNRLHYDNETVDNPPLSVDNGAIMGITCPPGYVVARDIGRPACSKP